MSKKRYGGWLITSTGRSFYPLDPKVDEVCIEDIAHSLSNLCRFGGHTREYLSVNQHCLTVSQLIKDEKHTAIYQLAGLLHDASEAYLVDIPSPVKRYLDEYNRVEGILLKVIEKAFKLPTGMLSCGVVKKADREALAIEAKQFVFDPTHLWSNVPTTPKKFSITPMEPRQAKLAYLRRFGELQSEIRRGK
jgi:hypothetical protein